MSDAAQRGFERDGRLCQRPVREVESLRRKCQPLSPVRLQGLQLLTENVQAAELLVTWHTVDSHAEHYGVRLGDGLRLYVDNQAGRLVLWRYYPEEGLDGYRSVELPDTEYLTLRIFWIVHLLKCLLTMVRQPYQVVFIRKRTRDNYRYMPLMAMRY